MIKALVASIVVCFAALAHAQVTLVHVHGLSYSADGKRLMIPSHFGLAIYESAQGSDPFRRRALKLYHAHKGGEHLV